MKVLRITRHAASQAQTAELQLAFGEEVDIVQMDLNMSSADRALQIVLANLPNAVEMVVPFEMLAEVVPLMHQIGVIVIRAKMDRDRETQKMEFSHYEVVDEIAIKVHPLSRHRFRVPSATSHPH